MSDPLSAPARIAARVLTKFFTGPILDNTQRGYFCEAMVAEMLGPAARIVSHGWHPWDIEFGDTRADFPQRIRIQVKNSARLQTWQRRGPDADCSFILPYRRRPGAAGPPGVTREERGFLCDLFALCDHPETDRTVADHTDPAQWLVCLLPTDPRLGAITPGDIACLDSRLASATAPAIIRTVRTLAQGIRGRRAPCIRSP